MNTVGALVAQLRLDDADYQAALKRAPGLASQTAAKINDSFARSPAIDKTARSIAGLSDDIRLQVAALGIGARSWAEFTAAGKATGASQQEILRTFAGLRGQLDLARVGTKGTIDAFADLGLNWRSLARLSPEESLARVARATFSSAEGSKAYAAGLNLLGAQSAPQLQRVLRQLAVGDLPALTKATGAAASAVRDQLGSAFLRFAGPALLIGGITKLTTSTLHLANDLKNLAAASDLTIDRFQTLDYVARQNGTSGDQFVQAIASMRNKLADAAAGGDAAQKAFARLGLDWRELNRLSTSEQLETIAKAMLTAGAGTETFGAAADILGSRRLPQLNQAILQVARDGFPALDKAARESGQVLDTAMVKQLEAAQQALENFKRSATVFFGDNVLGGWAEIFGSKGSITASITETQKALLELRTQEQHSRDSAASRPAGRPATGFAADNDLFELNRAREQFVSAILNQSGTVDRAIVTKGQEALTALRESLQKRGKLTGDKLKEIEDMERAFATRVVAIQKQAAADSFEATKSGLLDQLAREIQQERATKLLAQQATKSSGDILSKGRTDIALAELDTRPAEKIAALEREITEQLRIQVDLKATKDDRDEAARRVVAAEKQIADLRRSERAALQTPTERRDQAVERAGVLRDGTAQGEADYARAVQRANEALRDSVNLRTPAEALAHTIERLQRDFRDNGGSATALADAIRDAKDAAREIKDPTEQYASTLERLNRLQRDGLISTQALALARRNATEALGSSRIGEIARTGNTLGAGRSNSAADRAQKELQAARDAFNQGDQNSARFHASEAERLAQKAGPSFEQFIGTPEPVKPRDRFDDMRDKINKRFDDMRSNLPDGGAAALAAGSTPNSITNATGTDARSAAPKLSPDVDALVKAIKAIATKLVRA